MGLAAGGNGNNRLDWEWNGNKTWHSLAPGMEMNSWEREAVALKKTFPLISTSNVNGREY